MEFNQCTLIYLESKMGLKPVRQNETLQAWLNMPIELNELERQEITALQDLLDFNVYHWNEQELALHFIGPMFSLVHFATYQFNLFAGRSIRELVNEVELYGKPDGMIASGYRAPKIPYFCFQEYKKELDSSGDPAGQCLAAMLVGQTMNENRYPLYGAYVIGRDWYFMVLEDNEYAISHDYSAVTDAVFDIFRILKALKVIITGFAADQD